MKPRKHSFFLPLMICAFSLVTISNHSLVLGAQTEESELFLVAQKAFDDGFYDIAIRYIQEFFEKYPQTQKRIQAQLLLGQCYFFKGQYLKAFDMFQELLHVLVTGQAPPAIRCQVYRLAFAQFAILGMRVGLHVAGRGVCTVPAGNGGGLGGILFIHNVNPAT